MALTSTVTKESMVSNENKNNLWVNVPKNSSVKIIPLCDFMDTPDSITKYKQYEFDSGKKTFWTLPDTQELDDPCRILGFVSKEKWILPVLLFDEESKTWSQPMYFRIGQQILDGMAAVDKTIKGVSEDEGEPALTFKYSVLSIMNDVGKNGIPKYSVNWTSQHLSKSKEYKSGKIPLPVSTLNMIKGFVPFQVENPDDMTEIRNKIITRLTEKSDFEVEQDGVRVTIGELMKSKGLLTEENEFEMVGDFKDIPF